MKPAENTEKIVKKFDVDTNTEMNEVVLNELLKAQAKSKEAKPGSPQPNIWRIIMESKITQLATAVVVVTVCWLTVSDRDELEQQVTNGPVVAVESETPAELMSFISLSMVFRDGDMEAMEKQFDKAEKKVRPVLKEQITIDQLICELEECEEIQEGKIL